MSTDRPSAAHIAVIDQVMAATFQRLDMTVDQYLAVRGGHDTAGCWAWLAENLEECVALDEMARTLAAAIIRIAELTPTT